MQCPNCRGNIGSAKPLLLSGIERVLLKLRTKSHQQSAAAINQESTATRHDYENISQPFTAWCEICLVYFTGKDTLSALHCGHTFHMNCLADFRKE